VHGGTLAASVLSKPSSVLLWGLTLVFWDVELVKFVLRAWNRLWEAFAPLSLHVTSKLPIIMVSVIQHHTIMDSTTVIALLSTTPPKLETFHVYKRANALVPCIMGVMVHA
jgi:hypothetical protein